MYPSEERNNITRYAFGNELTWLRNAAKDFKHAVMIGAGPGVMALALKEGNPDLKLLVLDINTCYYTEAHLRAAGFHDVGFAQENSNTYNYKGPKLDFLLVDGDHTYEGVIKDIKNWIDRVKSGGIIFFHDFEVVNDDKTNGVAQAIDKARAGKIMEAIKIASPGISAVYRKK